MVFWWFGLWVNWIVFVFIGRFDCFGVLLLWFVVGLVVGCLFYLAVVVVLFA